ncbi:MAG: hypothetical protein LBU81_07415 [Methanosarcinales archaeon]|nr:hypothetical protein [Methanosarcinales archaeon]
MNATPAAIASDDFNVSIVLNETRENKNSAAFAPDEDEFFKGLIQRARFYEQFEDRKFKLTYSVIQTDIGVFTA